MRIAIVQGAFLPVPPLLGGAVEKMWFALGQEFVRLGHQVTHISSKNPQLPVVEDIEGVRHIRVKGYDTPSNLGILKFLDLLYSFRAVKAIPKNIDVIITNTFWSPILLRGETGKKVYVDVQRIPRGQIKFYTHAGLLRGCSRAIYESIKMELTADLHSMVSYVPNPVPFLFKPIDYAAKEKTILFVGRLHPEKGVHVLIEAFKLLHNDWSLIIIGPHDYEGGGGGVSYYEKLLSLVEKGDSINLIGPIYDDNELAKYYAKSSIFCYPVQNSSGDAAPVAPREAMAYGCVPLISKLECFRDFISDQNGVFFDQTSNNQPEELAMALLHIIDNESKRQQLSIEATKSIRNFSLPIIAEKFINDFSKIVA